VRTKAPRALPWAGEFTPRWGAQTTQGARPFSRYWDNVVARGRRPWPVRCGPLGAKTTAWRRREIVPTLADLVREVCRSRLGSPSAGSVGSGKGPGAADPLAARSWIPRASATRDKLEALAIAVDWSFPSPRARRGHQAAAHAKDLLASSDPPPTIPHLESARRILQGNPALKGLPFSPRAPDRPGPPIHGTPSPVKETFFHRPSVEPPVATDLNSGACARGFRPPAPDWPSPCSTS